MLLEQLFAKKGFQRCIMATKQPSSVISLSLHCNLLSTNKGKAGLVNGRGAERLACRWSLLLERLLVDLLV
jgi:hypothetical protein